MAVGRGAVSIRAAMRADETNDGRTALGALSLSYHPPPPPHPPLHQRRTPKDARRRERRAGGGGEEAPRAGVPAGGADGGEGGVRFGDPRLISRVEDAHRSVELRERRGVRHPAAEGGGAREARLARHVAPSSAHFGNHHDDE